MEIDVLTDKPKGPGFVLIRDENIHISEKRLKKNNRNNFRGNVMEISRSVDGFKAIIRIVGIDVSVSISEKTYKENYF